MGQGLRKANGPKDLTDLTFGRLTVLSLYDRTKSGLRWLCKCECGKETVVYRTSLIQGLSTSCGCYLKEISTTHGLSRHRIYGIWIDMKKRCFNERHKYFKNYGGRGIKVCDEWLDDFLAFRDWAVANDYADNLSIDRKDNDGNYAPENCHWVDRLTQNNNTRKNVFITIGDETKTISEWARASGLSEATIRKRFHSGVEGKDLLKIPKHTRRNVI